MSDDNLEQSAKTYIWACWLYYHAPPGDIESPLSDGEFDRLQDTLAAHWIETPDWFKALCPEPESLKTDAHSIALSPKEQCQALAWASSRPACGG